MEKNLTKGLVPEARKFFTEFKCCINIVLYLLYKIQPFFCFLSLHIVHIYVKTLLHSQMCTSTFFIFRVKETSLLDQNNNSNITDYQI